MPLGKDDIDAVAMKLEVDGRPRFMVMLTRGGLTKRMGSSEGTDPGPLLVTGRTDQLFEDFLAALPESLLEQGGQFEDEGRDGPRHEWHFELGGGMASIEYAIAYHAGSASLPDEFADLVTRAERLTHAWHQARLAEETGAAGPVSAHVPPPPAPAARASAGKAPRPSLGAQGGPGASASKKRIALAVLLDFFLLGIPWAYALALLPDGEGAGPPGAGLVIFAFVEFALLQFVRKSPGLWLLGIRWPLGAPATVEATWSTRESLLTHVVGTLLLASGASGLTQWTVDHTPTPYFGLTLGPLVSILFTFVFAAAYLVAGGWVLRTDLRGVWVGAGSMLLSLVAVVPGWAEWPAWLQAELANRAALTGQAAPGAAGLGGVATFIQLLMVVTPLAFLVGLAFTWKRFTGWKPAPRNPAPAATAR